MARHSGGWIKLHRSTMDNDIGSNLTLLGLWTKLLLMSNYLPSKIIWRGSPRELKTGEILTSITELAHSGGINRKTVSKYIKYLTKRGSILIEQAPNGSYEGIIIKINKYELYQAQDADLKNSDGQEHGQESGQEDGQETGQEHGQEDGHIIRNKEIKNKRNKEYKYDFESLYALYPNKVNKGEAFVRLGDQIKSDKDFENCKTAILNYIKFLKLDKNKDWLKPKQFNVFVGPKTAKVKPWHEWINPDPSILNNSTTSSIDWDKIFAKERAEKAEQERREHERTRIYGDTDPFDKCL